MERSDGNKVLTKRFADVSFVANRVFNGNFEKADIFRLIFVKFQNGVGIKIYSDANSIIVYNRSFDGAAMTFKSRYEQRTQQEISLVRMY